MPSSEQVLSLVTPSNWMALQVVLVALLLLGAAYNLGRSTR